jgi:hypothetical protein
MRWLIGVVVAAALVWGGVWFALSGAVRRGAEAAIEGLVQQGVAFGRPQVAVAGFPNRLDLTLTALRLADPATGADWSAPFLQAFAMTWKPWHVILAFPPEQRLSWAGGEAVLAADRLQASAVARPERSLPLDRLAVAGDGLRLTLTPAGGAPGTVSARSLRIGTRADPSRADTHEVGVEVQGLAPGPGFFAALAPGPALPAEVPKLRLTGFVAFTAPLDRFAGETRPALRALELREVAAVWGGIALEAKGAVAADADGFAEGRIDIRLKGWRRALDAAVAAGAVHPEIAPTWAEFARRLTEASADPDRLEIALVFGGGRMWLGPLPMGPAPRLAAP